MLSGGMPPQVCSRCGCDNSLDTWTVRSRDGVADTLICDHCTQDFINYTDEIAVLRVHDRLDDLPALAHPGALASADDLGVFCDLGTRARCSACGSVALVAACHTLTANDVGATVVNRAVTRGLCWHCRFCECCWQLVDPGGGIDTDNGDLCHMCANCARYCQFCTLFHADDDYQDAEDASGRPLCAFQCCACMAAESVAAYEAGPRWYCAQCVRTENAWQNDASGDDDEPIAWARMQATLPMGV